MVEPLYRFGHQRAADGRPRASELYSRARLPRNSIAGQLGRVALTPSFHLSTPQGRTWGEGSLVDVRGSSGLGFYRLSFDVRFHIEGAEDAAAERLVSLFADIALGSRPLGRAVALQQQLPVRPVGWGMSSQLVLDMDLDRSRLEALEDVRNGADLQLSLMVYSTLEDASGNTRPHTQQMNHTINQGVWVRILEAMDYQKRLLLEVPVPDVQAPPGLKDAVNLLARAQDAMARGDYRDAVGGCRDVVERIDSALKLTVDQAVFENNREKTKSERLKLIIRGLKVFTHPAKHSDDVSVTIEWNRIDASFAISAVAAVIAELSAPGARPT